LLFWKLDPAFPITPDTHVIHVLAFEIACGNGDPAIEPRLQPPVIDYRSDEILITMTVRPKTPDGLLACGETPLVVELGEPADGRRLVDPWTRLVEGSGPGATPTPPAT
jgi:hypothetical protein